MVSTTEDLDIILEKIEGLPVEALLIVQQRVTTQLRQKVATNGHSESVEVSIKSNGQAVSSENEDEEPDRIYPYSNPAIYRYTPQGIKKLLNSMFTAEEQERLDKIDLNNLPKLDKTITEYVSEAREERL